MALTVHPIVKVSTRVNPNRHSLVSGAWWSLNNEPFCASGILIQRYEKVFAPSFFLLLFHARHT